MTANGSDNHIGSSGTSVRIRSTVYLLGNYEWKARIPGEVTSEYITLVLSLKTPKANDVSLMMSFKHIVRIDLLDNSDSEGAGMVIYMNDHMAKRIEKYFNLETNSFLTFRNPYMNHAFIVLDILNSDKATIQTLKQVLENAAAFHRDYLLRRFQAENDPEPEKKLPKQYIWSMTPTYWRGLLATMHKDFFVEEVTIQSNDGKDIAYASGYMINMVSSNKCAVQADGRIMPVNSDQESIMSMRRRVMDIQQPRTFSLGKLHQGDGSPPKIPRYVTTTQPILRPKVDEIHTIEDDQAIDTGTHSTDNTVIAIYQPKDRVVCKICSSDLATLGPAEMLNDTVVDFYMNYILNDIVPAERRGDFHVFNSFFYTGLSKGLTTQKLLKTRSKKIAENYATLKNWTRKVNIFSKKYIVVPINEDTHWYLAVIVNPSIGFVTGKENTGVSTDGASTSSSLNAQQVPVFIFDSLLDDSSKKHRVVAELLMEYLHLEFRDKKSEHQLQAVAYRKNSCRVILPENTPQQQNHYDCGVYMLSFAESFMAKPPKFDDIAASISYTELFGNVDLNGKREEIRQLISNLSENSAR